MRHLHSTFAVYIKRITNISFRAGCIATLLALAACTTPIEPPANVVIQNDTLGQAVIIGQLTPVGSILPYAGEIVPNTRAALASQGWLVCDGAEVSRELYVDLYQVVGHAHGSGNDRTTFDLPDYRGMFLRGVSGNSKRDQDASTRMAAAKGGRQGNAIGSVQADTIGLHQHTDIGMVESNSMNAVIGSVSPTPGMKDHDLAAITGKPERETRPINVYVHYLIFSGIKPQIDNEP